MPGSRCSCPEQNLEGQADPVRQQLVSGLVRRRHNHFGELTMPASLSPVSPSCRKLKTGSPKRLGVARIRTPLEPADIAMVTKA